MAKVVSDHAGDGCGSSGGDPATSLESVRREQNSLLVYLMRKKSRTKTILRYVAGARAEGWTPCSVLAALGTWRNAAGHWLNVVLGYSW
jgi:hypothetical protein